MSGCVAFFDGQLTEEGVEGIAAADGGGGSNGQGDEVLIGNELDDCFANAEFLALSLKQAFRQAPLTGEGSWYMCVWECVRMDALQITSHHDSAIQGMARKGVVRNGLVVFVSSHTAAQAET